MEHIKKNYVTIVISVVLALAFLFLTISLVKIKKSSYPGDQANQNVNYPKGKAQTLVLSSDSSQWTVGERQNLAIEFSEIPSVFPTVYTLDVTVDPAVLEIVSTDSGDMWSEVNVLENTIDKTKGTLRLTVGQGFTAEKTGGKVLTNITLLPKKATNGTEITIGDESQSAKAGVGSSLIAEPFVVSIY